MAIIEYSYKNVKSAKNGKAYIELLASEVEALGVKDGDTIEAPKKEGAKSAKRFIVNGLGQKFAREFGGEEEMYCRIYGKAELYKI